MRRSPRRSKAEVLKEFGGAQFSTFKAALVDLAVAKLGPINAEMKRLVADPVYIDSVLADGAARAQVDRRRDHESGQGHRRLRAPLSSAIRPLATVVSRAGALVPLPSGVAGFLHIGRGSR